MYVAVLKLPLDKKKLDEGKRVWNGEIRQKLAKEDGLQGSFFIVDESTGEGLSIGFWRDENVAKKFESSGRIGEIFKPIEPFLSAPRSRHVYDLVGLDGLSLKGGEEASIGYGAEQGAPAVH